MHDDKFDWDDAKAVSNVCDHGLTFELALQVFDDAFAIASVDEEQDTIEDRFILLGMVENRVLFVS